METTIMGYIIYPKPYSIYLRGTTGIEEVGGGRLWATFMHGLRFEGPCP